MQWREVSKHVKEMKAAIDCTKASERCSSVYVYGSLSLSLLWRVHSFASRSSPEAGIDGTMSDPASQNEEEERRSVPVLVVPEVGSTTSERTPGGSAPSSPRSVSPTRPSTPPLDDSSASSPATARSESAGISSKKRSSHSRSSGAGRRANKPKETTESKDANSDDESPTVREKRSSSPSNLQRSNSLKSQPSKISAARPSSSSAITTTAEKNGKETKKATTPRPSSGGSSPAIAPSKGAYCRHTLRISHYFALQLAH